MRFISGIGVVLAILMGFSGAGLIGQAHAEETAKPTKLAALERATATKTDVSQPVGAQVEKAVKKSVIRRPVRRSPTLVAKIDLTRQRITVTAHGRTVYHWKISSGRAGYHTPRGTFRPKWAAKMHYSRKYDGAPMPYAVFFNGGVATHGTNAVGRLGSPASHGCIRLHTANARRLYKLVMKHGYARTRFVVTGATPQTRVIAKRKTRRNVARYRAPQPRVRRYQPKRAYRPSPRYFAPQQRYYAPRRYTRRYQLTFPGDGY